MKPLKTIVTAILLCAMLAPVAVQLAGFIKITQLHESFETRLRHQLLHTITLPENAIVWAKPGKEIWYQGRMFDIKERTVKNGIVTFRGLFDDEEKALKAQLARETRQKGKTAAQNLAQMFMTGLYMQPETPYNCTAAVLPVQTITAGFLASRYISVHICSPAPPPWRFAAC